MSEGRKGVVERKGGDIDRFTAYLPIELGSRLRSECAVKRVDLSSAIAEGVELWLKRGKR